MLVRKAPEAGVTLRPGHGRGGVPGASNGRYALEGKTMKNREKQVKTKKRGKIMKNKEKPGKIRKLTKNYVLETHLLKSSKKPGGF